MKKALKLQEHKHTAKILHHKHTSYRGLAVVMLVFGLSLVLIGKSASAADYVLNARVAAPLPTIPAQITSPANNSTVSTTNIVISGTCPIVTPAIIVVLYRADVMLGSAGCSADGKFAGTYNLAEGNNLITPKISTITLDAGLVGNTNNRDAGTPEWQPTYENGQTVRFAATNENINYDQTKWQFPRMLYMQHASDPVVWFNFNLLTSKPDWLNEKRGPDVSSTMRWYPIITFFQVTVDQFFGVTVPNGHGHNYPNTIVNSWGSIVPPEGWNSDMANKLQDIITPYPNT